MSIEYEVSGGYIPPQQGKKKYSLCCRGEIVKKSDEINYFYECMNLWRWTAQGRKREISMSYPAARIYLSKEISTSIEKLLFR